MKHLLIILISFLLLSSPVFGDNHKDETLYRWGNTLTYVWKGFGDKYTHSVYIGTVKNGKPNVQGTETLSDGKKYEGEWKDGKYHGQGTLTHPNGEKYVGEFKKGKRHGQGIHTYPNGEKYEGEYMDGENWNGTGYDKNGNIQVKFVNGKMIDP